MAKILIKNGRVWNGEEFSYADVLTDGDRIAKIEQNITDDANYVYDASEKIVSAGLVDTHVHMLGFEPDMYGINVEMGCLPFGVTAAADAGGAHANREIAASYQVKNVTFVTAKIKDDKADFAVTEKKMALYGERVIGVKVYFDATSPQVRSIKPLQEICAYAKERGLKVMVHCAHSPAKMSEILDTLNKGDILTHAYHGGENNASEDHFDAVIAAKKRGIIIDSGFAGHIHTDFAVFKKAVENGALPDTISTDITRASAYKRGGRYGMTMCMSMARHMGMSEIDIFRAVTANPAKVLGKSDEWGYLRVGRIADIAVLDYTDEGFDLTDKAGNHIESPKGYRCVLTVSDGQVVYRN
jgi:dihydroorotase